MTALQSNLVHCVIAVKSESPQIPHQALHELHSFLADVAEDMGAAQLAAGGVQDHVHLLLSLPPTLALSDLIAELKRVSRCWLSNSFADCQRFEWDDDHTAFSVGMSQIRETSAYIERQLECHRKIDFRQEMMLFGEAYKIGIA